VAAGTDALHIFAWAAPVSTAAASAMTVNGRKTLIVGKSFSATTKPYFSLRTLSFG
jgi:hypothetical protein